MTSPTARQEWPPSCFLIAHGPTIQTTIHYSPRHVCRREARYCLRLRVYDRSLTEPAWTYESEEGDLASNFSVRSGEIAQAIGKPSFLLYGEADTWSPDYAPELTNTGMGVHSHYASTNASFRGHLASFSIYGVPRLIQRGESYYENFPAALVNERHRLSVYSVNPFVRSTRVSVMLIHDGGVWESEPTTLRGKSVAEWNSLACGFPGSEKPLGAIVKSELKITSFFATRDAAGRMIGLDHGHPFLTQVLSH